MQYSTTFCVSQIKLSMHNSRLYIVTVFIAYFFNENKPALLLKIVVNFLYLLNSNNSYCYFCVVYSTRLRFMSFTKIAFKLFTLVNVRPNALLDY